MKKGKRLLQTAIAFLKQHKQRMRAGACAAFLAAAVCAEPQKAFAAELVPVNYTVEEGIDVYFNNSYVTMLDKQQREVECFKWEGTTYAPARSLVELFGYSISWNSQDNSILIDKTTPPVMDENNLTFVFSAGYKQEKEIHQTSFTGKSGVALFVKDETGTRQVVPKDVNGREKPILFGNGTNYLPIRTISEIAGREIRWEASVQGVAIGEFDYEVAKRVPDGGEIKPQATNNNNDFMSMYWKYKECYYYIDSYYDMITERENLINSIIVDAGFHLEQMNLDLTDPTLKGYYDEYVDVWLDLQDDFIDLTQYNVRSDLRFCEQTVFVRVENGTYTEDDVTAITLEYNYMDERLEKLPIVLANTTPEIIEQKKQNMEAVIEKIDNYVFQKYATN